MSAASYARSRPSRSSSVSTGAAAASWSRAAVAMRQRVGRGAIEQRDRVGPAALAAGGRCPEYGLVVGGRARRPGRPPCGRSPRGRPIRPAARRLQQWPRRSGRRRPAISGPRRQRSIDWYARVTVSCSPAVSVAIRADVSSPRPSAAFAPSMSSVCQAAQDVAAVGRELRPFLLHQVQVACEMVDPRLRGKVGAVGQLRPLDGVARPVGGHGEAGPTERGEDEHHRPPQVQPQRARPIGGREWMRLEWPSRRV